MKIKLICDVPVGTEHGMRNGRILETIGEIQYSGGNKRNSFVWVKGDAGEKVKVWQREFEIVQEN